MGESMGVISARTKAGFRRDIMPMILIAPAFILHTFLLVNPILQTIYLSFFSWNGIPTSPLKYIGFNNYLRMFTSGEFWTGMKNIGAFILSSFIVTMPISFGLALIITSEMRGRKLFRALFFIPVIISQTAVSLMWTFILYPKGGLLNNILMAVGLENLVNDWLGNPSIAIFSVVLVNSWVSVGLNMIIFSAGIVSIPEDIYQAARIDGAGGISRLWYITIPMLRNTFNVYTVLNLIGCIKAFEIVFVMTRGGPNGMTDVPVTLLYKYAFKYNYFGYGSSIGTFILIVCIVVTVIINKYVIKTEVE